MQKIISNRFEITSKSGYQHDFAMLIMSNLYENYVHICIDFRKRYPTHFQIQLVIHTVSVNTILNFYFIAEAFKIHLHISTIN